MTACSLSFYTISFNAFDAFDALHHVFSRRGCLLDKNKNAFLRTVLL